MLYKLLIGPAVGVAFLATAGMASAMVDIDFLVVDGGPNTTVEPGDNIAAKVTFDTDGEDVESFSWRLVGSDIPKVCVNTVDVTNPDGGTFVRSFTIDLTTQGEGTWDVDVRSYGDNGANSSNLCETMDENDQTTFDDRVTIVDNIDDNQDNDNDPGNNDTAGSGNNDKPSWVDGFLAAILAALKPPATVPPAAPAKCAAVQAKLIGTQMNVYNQANVMLQGFLLSEGQSIPALTAGASFGYYGPQTAAALASFKAQHQCI